MDRRRLPRLVTASLLLVAVCGCARGTAGSTDRPDFDGSSPVDGPLNVMGFGATDDVGESRLDTAESGLGDVDLSLIEGELDVQQFMSAVSTGEPPDLIYADRDQIGSFASRDAIMPLDECAAGEGIDLGDYRAPALAQVTFDDHVYGIPEFNQVQLTMANTELLDRSGLKISDVDGSDWEAVASANRKLHAEEDGELSTIGFDPKLPEFLPLWAKANGATLLSADGRTANLDDPEVVEALEFAADLYRDQGGFGAVKAERDASDFFGEENQFATGTLGAMPMEQWYVNILNDVSPDAKTGFGTVKDRNGEPLAFSSGSAWAIPEGSANPRAACRFAKIMTAEKTWTAAARERSETRKADGKPFTGLLTGNERADEAIHSEFVDTSGNSVWDEAVTATYEANDHTFSLPANPADAEFTDAWENAANDVLNGESEPAEALRKAQSQAQHALDETWRDWDGGDG